MVSITPKGRIFNNITEVVGSTPLIRAKRFSDFHELECNLLVKLEFLNPLFSVKDRVAVSIIENAENEGQISPDKTTIIEASSGSMANSLAMVCAAKGYKLILVMPESASFERRKMLQLLGAKIEVTPAEAGMKGATERLSEFMESDENYFCTNQFSNPEVIQVHHDTTAPEIWEDTGGKADIFIAGVGTGGMISGVSRFLKSKNKDIVCVAVEPASSPLLSGGDVAAHGIQGIGAGFIPDNYDKDVIDQIIAVEDERAFELARNFAKYEGVPVGISSGANLAACIEIGKREENKGKTIVTVANSQAERYMDTDLFGDFYEF